MTNVSQKLILRRWDEMHDDTRRRAISFLIDELAGSDWITPGPVDTPATRFRRRCEATRAQWDIWRCDDR